MNINRVATSVLLSFSLLISHAQTIAPSDPGITTYTLSGGNFTIGISSTGGRYINMIELPGKGDMMELATDLYGRSGQSAMRDQLELGKSLYALSPKGTNGMLALMLLLLLSGSFRHYSGVASYKLIVRI